MGRPSSGNDELSAGSSETCACCKLRYDSQQLGCVLIIPEDMSCLIRVMEPLTLVCSMFKYIFIPLDIVDLSRIGAGVMKMRCGGCG